MAYQNSKYFWEKKLQVSTSKLPFFGRKRERNQKRTVYKMWIGRQEWINTDFDRSNWVWMCKCGCWWARGPFFSEFVWKKCKKGINSDYQSQFSVFRLWSILNMEFEQKSISTRANSISRTLIVKSFGSQKVTWSASRKSGKILTYT